MRLSKVNLERKDPNYWRTWYHANPKKVKNQSLKNYGITLEEYEDLLQKQGHKCALCKEEQGQKSFCVDHDHRCCNKQKYACKKCIRGLLCHRCNSTHLPWLEKHPELQNEVTKAYLSNRPFNKEQLC